MTKKNISHATPKVDTSQLRAAASEAASGRFEGFCNAVFAGALARRDQRGKATAYLAGLLSEGKKSMEPLGWRVGVPWQNVQNFITDCAWDCDALWDELTTRLAEVTSPDVLVIDETTLQKSGEDSVGVAYQYCGRLGGVANCQTIVTAHLSGERGSGMVGSHLCMPKEWVYDAARREKAGVPTALKYETKVELAERHVAHLRALGLGYLVVLGDAAYGDSSDFRMGLEAAAQPFVLAVKNTTSVQPDGIRAARKRNAKTRRWPRSAWSYAKSPVSVRKFARQHKGEFVSVSWKNPDGAAHTSRFAKFVIRPATEKYQGAYTRQGVDAPQNTLLVEWPEGNNDPVRYWLSSMPASTPIERLVGIAKRRWRVEQDYRELKGELGLEEFQGRKFHGLAHHVVLCAAAQLFLTLERAAGHWRESFAARVGPRCAHSIATVRALLQPALRRAILGWRGLTAGFD